MMAPYVIDFADVRRDTLALVGGKGAHLATLRAIEGIAVPEGFCVTTRAFAQFLALHPSMQRPLSRLSRLRPGDETSVRMVSAELRALLSAAPLGDEIEAAIAQAHARFGADAAFAVRSSATAEDQPAHSFAGQHDTYLNVIGRSAVLDRVRQCWASLFTERAVAYRLRNDLEHEHIRMAVIVQVMVFPHAAGAMFTADPVSGHRRVTRIEAAFGLGAALVDGTVQADAYTVRDAEIMGTTIGTKHMELVALPGGGTGQQPVVGNRQSAQVLTPAQILELAAIGRRINDYFASPQDIEWALVGAVFHILQSRPITTLFPVPDVGAGPRRVFVSVGHQQMMTDAMRPLGLSMWQRKAGRPMHEAAGRCFVDVTDALANPASRAALLGGLGKSDQLIGDALQTLVDRGDFASDGVDSAIPSSAASSPAAIATDPQIVHDLIARFQAAMHATQQGLRGKTGVELLDFIQADIDALRALLFDATSMQVIFAAIDAAWWLNAHLDAWLGERNAADTLSLSVTGNITAEMGLALLDVADVVRPHAAVVRLLEEADDPRFMEDLPSVSGGQAAKDAMIGWLNRYGVRGAGEIDITRPRFHERPDMLLPMILGNVRHMSPDAGVQRVERGRQAAAQYEQLLLERLRALPDGAEKATETARMIARVRTFAGYREYPKYAMVSREFAYKQALLAEADRLVQAGVLEHAEDLFYLRFDELRGVVRGQRVSAARLRERRQAYRTHLALTPPRVITSDGECISGAYRRDRVPTGALCGLPVSPGIVEGRVRVILDLTQAHVQPGEILVTAFTDPSWTPLFLSLAGLITEVGGLMTHGAVIAREYGLPAIVGVDHATSRLRDGQRVRLNATDGYVVVLTEPERATPERSPSAGDAACPS